MLFVHHIVNSLSDSTIRSVLVIMINDNEQRTCLSLLPTISVLWLCSNAGFFFLFSLESKIGEFKFQVKLLAKMDPFISIVL